MKSFGILRRVARLLLLAGCGIASSEAQILVNGSFESDLAGWMKIGNVAIGPAATYTATSGVKLVTFNNGNSTPNGVLSQTLGTIQGQTYSLAFDAGVFGTAAAQKIQVSATGSGAGTLLTREIEMNGIGGFKPKWYAHAFTFVANSTSTTLIFRDLSATTNDVDLMLDNVRVTAAASAPLAVVNDAATIHAGQKVRVPVLANDTGALNLGSLQIVTPPSTGTATVQPSGEILYAHSGSGTGPVSFSYRISDSGGQTQTGNVTITISSALRISNSSISMPGDPPPTAVQVVQAFPGVVLLRPHCIASPPGDAKRLFVAEHGGKLKVIPDVTAANPTSSLVLDLVQAITSPPRTPAESWNPALTDEAGFLGFAFHPNYASNGYIYVIYSLRKATDSAALYQRLSRFTVPAAQIGQPAPVANPASELILIEQRDRHVWHNGGDLHFGTDGYLYWSIGDEGGEHDTYGNSQRIDMNFFSSMLRIDVDKKPGNLEPNAHPNPAAVSLGYGPGNSIPRDEVPAGSGIFKARYSIPIDNPFVSISMGGTWDGVFNGSAVPAATLPYIRSEIWAMGFRNPWRFSIDEPTGDIWLGDVGAGSYEELDLVTKGGNYGWGYLEGVHPGPRPAPPGFSPVPPLYEYSHGEITGGDSNFKGNAIIGGVVYRGTRFSSLSGSYVFGDYVSGAIWALTRPGGVPSVQRIAGQVGLTAFGTDPSNGDVLLTDFNNGRIMRIISNTIAAGFPATLSETGLFADLGDLSPAPGLLPYTPILRFWSDFAVKRRWFTIPDATSKMTWSRDGSWTFPSGQIWVKHFDLESVRGDSSSPKKRIETRVLVKNAGGVYGVSYKWNAAGTEATLVGDGGEDVPVDVTVDGAPHTQLWQIPSRSQCNSCHSPQAGLALSFNTRQLNLDNMIHGFSGNQLELLQGAGYFTNTPGSPATLPRHVTPDDSSASLENRVRSYLAVNCSYCHAGNSGTAPTDWDGRPELTLSQTGLINGSTAVGNPYKLIVPANTGLSLVLQRLIGTDDFSRMPPLATHEVDPEGIALVTAWINSMEPGANTAPVAVADAYTTAQNTALVVFSVDGVLSNDIDAESDALAAVLLTGVGHGTVSLNSNGGFTYTPATGYSGPDWFTYRANDGSLDSDVVTVTLTVTPAGPPPVTGILVNGSFESNFTGWTTSGNQAIQSTAPYVPTDGVKLVSFNSGNTTPNAVLSQSFATVAGATYTLTFDVGVLSYNTEPQTLLATVNGNGSLLSRSITLNGFGGGSCRWLPQSFSFVSNSATSTLTFRDQSASTNALDLVLDHVQVTGPPPPTIPNTAPVAVGDAYSTDEDIALVVPASGVLGNDTDAESNPLAAVINAGPGHGSVTLNANGGFTYTPNAGYFGPDSFTYHANDGSLDSNVVTVGITINEVPEIQEPLAVADAYSTRENTPLVVPAAGVLANDADAQSNPLTAMLDSGPGHGSLILEADGSFTYTPDTDYFGPDSFTYHANDGSLDSNIVTVSITVTEVVPNTGPVAVADTYSANADTALVVPPAGVLANDIDSQSDPLTAVLDAGPEHGSILLNANGGFTYTPDADYTGPDSFTYHANDGELDSNTVTVSISVNAVVAVALVNGSFESGFTGWNFTGNQTIQSTAPFVATDGVKLVGFNGGNSTPNAVLSQGFATAAGQSYTLSFDAGVLSYNTATQTLQVTVTGNNPLLSRTINIAGLGGGSNRWLPQSFTFVADGPLSTLTFRDQSTSTISLDLILDNVRVSEVASVPNTAPVAVADQYVVSQNNPLVVPPAGVLANDSDAESTPLAAVLTTGPGNGTLTLNSNGGFTYTPASGFTGVDSFVYQASDGTAGSNLATVTLNVVPPPSGGLVNGSFESDYTGWTWTGNQQIRASAAPYVASQGTRLVGFNGGNSAPSGVLSQAFATTPGVTYRLDFDAGVLAYNTEAQRLRVTVTGAASLLSQVVTVTGLGNGGTRWIAQSSTFTADNSLTTLTFRDQSDSTNAIDLLLDNVRLTGLSVLAGAPAPTITEPGLQALVVSVLPGTEIPDAPALTGPPGDITIRMDATRSGRYILECSDDLVRWEKGGEMEIDGPGPVEFRDTADPDVSPPPRKFYRIYRSATDGK